MKKSISPQEKKRIKEMFSRMQSVEDLADILNEALEIIYSNKPPKKVTVRSIQYFSNPYYAKKRYKTFSIKKKSGGLRTIHAPVKDLKIILKALNFIFQCLDDSHRNAHGFTAGKSIVSNAQNHIGANYVYNIDLKDFFHSFDRRKVKYGLMRSPFNLKDERESLAYRIAGLCTHPIEMDGVKKTVLPQGSPVSPVLTNMLSKTLDRRLNGLAKRFGVRYTRYADDITFSSMHNVYSNPEFLDELQRIIEEQGFRINTKKTRLQKRGYRQEVTGLTVNEKTNVKRRYIKQIRLWLYLWERYGYAKALQLFSNDYERDKGHIRNVDSTQLFNVLKGKLLFLKMVKGETDSTYVKLKKRYDRLMSRFDPLNKFLEDWEVGGLDKLISNNENYAYNTQAVPLDRPKVYTENPNGIYKWKIGKKLTAYLVRQAWGIFTGRKNMRTVYRYSIILAEGDSEESINDFLEKDKRNLVVYLSHRPFVDKEYERWLKKNHPEKWDDFIRREAMRQVYKKSNGELVLINGKVAYRTILLGINDRIETGPDQEEFLTPEIKELKTKTLDKIVGSLQSGPFMPKFVLLKGKNETDEQFLKRFLQSALMPAYVITGDEKKLYGPFCLEVQEFDRLGKELQPADIKDEIFSKYRVMTDEELNNISKKQILANMPNHLVLCKDSKKSTLAKLLKGNLSPDGPPMLYKNAPRGKYRWNFTNNVTSYLVIQEVKVSLINYINGIRRVTFIIYKNVSDRVLDKKLKKLNKVHGYNIVEIRSHFPIITEADKNTINYTQDENVLKQIEKIAKKQLVKNKEGNPKLKYGKVIYRAYILNNSRFDKILTGSGKPEFLTPEIANLKKKVLEIKKRNNNED